MADRILIVDTKLSLIAAQELLPGYLAAMVGEIPWDLSGATVLLWPSASKEAVKTMRKFALNLQKQEAHVRFIEPRGVNGGWNLDQARMDCWTTAQTVEWARERAKDFVADPEPTAPNPPAVTRGRPRSKPDGSPPAGIQLEDDGSVFVSWAQLGLKTNDKGRPEDNLSNAMITLSNHPALRGKIWADDFLQRIMTTWNGPKREWKDGDDLLLAAWFQSVLSMPKLSVKTAREAVQAVAFMNRRNELTDWIGTLTWDGIERLPTMISDAFGAPQNDYSAAVGRCWLVSMIARAFKPGAKVDYLPVFEGGEGANKSTAMSILGGQWFAECHEKITDKDFLQALQGVWLIEIAELNSFSKSEIRRIKGIISCQDDRYRASYGRYTERHPRQCVFCATTNEDEWNESDTGARRFWPVRCGEVSADYLRANREQLFAEAVHRYNQGEKWWDVPVDLAKEEQDSRRPEDPWHDKISHWAAYRNECTMSEVLNGCLELGTQNQDRRAELRVGKCLRYIGFIKAKKREGKRQFKVWIRGVNESPEYHGSQENLI